MNEMIRRAGLAALLFALAACGGPAPSGNASGEAPLAGARIGGPFTLTDQDGQRVSDTRFAGQYRIMYFGYTYCPDICPVDVQRIGAAMRQLEKSDPEIAKKITPVFVSVDPERDGPKEVKAFVSNFHPRMVGLTGTPEEIAKVAKDYGIYYARVPSQTPDAYLVDHMRTTYLMGPNGEPIVLLQADESPEAIVADLKRWVT